jgi:hypothetical protein
MEHRCRAYLPIKNENAQSLLTSVLIYDILYNGDKKLALKFNTNIDCIEITIQVCSNTDNKNKGECLCQE